MERRALRGISWSLAGLASLSACGAPPGDSDAASSSSTADATLATASTADDSSTSSSSGVESECGNGIVEPGEQCDLEPVAGVPCPRSCVFESGAVLWETVFDGNGGRSPVSGNDRPDGIDVSEEGVFVVGSLGTVGYGDDALIAKLSPAGELLWVVGHVVDPVAAGGHHAHDVSLDGNTMLIAGDTFQRPWVGRFDLDDGAPIWQAIFEVPAEGDGDFYIAGSVSASSDGRVALLGYANLGYEQPGFISFHDDSGSLLETQWFGGPQYSPGYSAFGGLRATTADNGDLLIAGRAFHPGPDAWMHRRTLDGRVLWEVTGPGDQFTRAAVAADGTIAIATPIPSARGDDDIWVGTYSGNGDLLWADVWTGSHGDDWPTGVAVDGLGRVFVHGTVLGGGDHDMVVLAYAPDGDRLWESIYMDDGSDYSGPMAIDPLGFLVIAGHTRARDEDYDVVVRLLAP